MAKMRVLLVAAKRDLALLESRGILVRLPGREPGADLAAELRQRLGEGLREEDRAGQIDQEPDIERGAERPGGAAGDTASPILRP